MITSQGKMPLEYYFDKNYELEEQLKTKKKQDLLDQCSKKYGKLCLYETKRATLTTSCDPRGEILDG
jgi:UTP-glucose-1-phosphate uridylyltransferase